MADMHGKQYRNWYLEQRIERLTKKMNSKVSFQKRVRLGKQINAAKAKLVAWVLENA